jgi:hypothetical protein
VRQYGSLGEQLRAQVVQGAVAAPIRAPESLRPHAVDVVTEVRKAGLHGLDLGPIKHLSDVQLLPLRLLLDGGETTSTQANALGVLGQLGGVQSVGVVMDYVQQQPAASDNLKKLPSLLWQKIKTPMCLPKPQPWSFKPHVLVFGAALTHQWLSKRPVSVWRVLALALWPKASTRKLWPI